MFFVKGKEVTARESIPNFAALVKAMREGCGVFENIRKFLRYVLSSNLAEVLTVFLGVMGAGFIGLTATGTGEVVVLPLLAAQILWINLITDTGSALAMGVAEIGVVTASGVLWFSELRKRVWQLWLALSASGNFGSKHVS